MGNLSSMLNYSGSPSFNLVRDQEFNDIGHTFYALNCHNDHKKGHYCMIFTLIAEELVNFLTH